MFDGLNTHTGNSDTKMNTETHTGTGRHHDTASEPTEDTRLGTRARSMLLAAGYNLTDTPAIAALVGLACCAPKIRFADYAGYAEGYRKDSRGVTEDLARVRRALETARNDGVVDADVLGAAPGRLEYSAASGEWSYCAGQNYPTEYRAAVGALLERAYMARRQSREPRAAVVGSIAELRELNAINGGHWFSRGAMKFFVTRVESGIIGGRYFVTSEQPPHGRRGYTVRSFDTVGRVNTVGELCGWGSREDAMAAARSEGVAV